MRRILQVPPRYRILTALGILFVTLIVVYLFSGELLGTVGQTVVQGEKLSARHILAVIIWLLAAQIANIAINIFVWEDIIHKRTGAPVPKLLKSTASTIIFLIALIFIVALVFHKSITGLLATTGGIGIVVGLSLRGILENAAQGIALNVAQVFKPGDVISIPGRFDELAIVKDVTMRNTYLEDFVGRMIAIPNSVVCANVIRNYSRGRIFSVSFTLVLGVSDLPILDALRIFNAVVTSADYVVRDPLPQIVIAGIDNNQARYEIYCWTERDKISPLVAKHQLIATIIEQLSAAGFPMGSPYIDLEDVEKHIMSIIQKYDNYSHLKESEKEDYFSHVLADQRPLTVLRQVTLFANLTTDELEDLCHSLKPYDFKAGETIIHQGDTGDVMYILVEGALQVYIKSSETADLIPVAKLLPGRYFGEMGMLMGEPRSATVTALSDALIYEISKETMGKLFKKHPDMVQKISDKIAEQQMMNLIKQKEYSAPEAQTQKRNIAGAFVKRILKFFGKKREG